MLKKGFPSPHNDINPIRQAKSLIYIASACLRMQTEHVSNDFRLLLGRVEGRLLAIMHGEKLQLVPRESVQHRIVGMATKKSRIGVGLVQGGVRDRILRAQG